MKTLKLLPLITVSLSLMFTTLSCTNDDIETKKPIDSIGVTPPKTMFKPAVVNLKNSNTTGKSTVLTKKLVKTISYYQTSVFDKTYKTMYTAEEYAALPTDNLYDVREDSLNVSTNKYDERAYTYNSSNLLEKITINNIAYPEYNSRPAYAPIIFEYTTDGSKMKIMKYQNSGIILDYVYNSLGQIIAANELNGTPKYTFEYDEHDNISSQYFYYTDPNGITKPQMHHTYAYYPNNTYVKTWFAVNPDNTETKSAEVTYTYDKNVAGVYNNEAVYKVLFDNATGLPYLHIISNTVGSNPKYFYDAEGYLIKFDKHGKNMATDITRYFYE